MKHEFEGLHAELLKLDLVGQQSNRLGIEARIEIVTPDEHFQMREMNGGVHNYAQDEMVISFGLGEQASVASLTVYWPRGAVQQLTNVAADQRLVSVEADTGAVTPTPKLTPIPTATPTLTTAPSPTATPPAVKVIVDNLDPGFSTTSFWGTGSNTRNSFSGSNYRYTAAGDRSRQALFSPGVAAGGDYELFIWFFGNSRLGPTCPTPFTIMAAARASLSLLHRAARDAGIVSASTTSPPVPMPSWAPAMLPWLRGRRCRPPRPRVKRRMAYHTIC